MPNSWSMQDAQVLRVRAINKAPIGSTQTSLSVCYVRSAAIVVLQIRLSCRSQSHLLHGFGVLPSLSTPDTPSYSASAADGLLSMLTSAAE